MGYFCEIVDGKIADFFGRVFTPCQPEPELNTRPLSLEGMAKVHAGTFEMGSINGDSDEMPVHEVTITHDYYLDETEVTNKAYTSVTGKNPSPKGFDGPDQPVTNVSWHDADRYCKAIGKRLPTEAEWENAASVGGKYLFGTKSGAREKLTDEACVDKNKTCNVKAYPPNELGLYGMSGNLWEWVSDWKGDYPSEPVVDPQGPEDGWTKVLRGGSWGSGYSVVLRAANRSYDFPDGSYFSIGFRCATDAVSGK